LRESQHAPERVGRTTPVDCANILREKGAV
jgi:hypothetical protein